MRDLYDSKKLVTHLSSLEVQLGVTAEFHAGLERERKGAVLHSLHRVVVELVEQDLAVHNHKALHRGNLHSSSVAF